jgi:hypothetical protein
MQSYANNGQTTKSGGYSMSTDGGLNFTKPNYANNRIIATNTAPIVGLPTGEGDFGVVDHGDYYYLFFENVEQYCILHI